MAGKTYNTPPMAPDPASTDYFEVGPLRIGIEYRKLDPATIEAAYEGNADQLAEIRENSPEGGFTDEGISFHVEGVEAAHEFLRFDAFADDPHYHYIHPTEGTNTIFDFDVIAHGPMIPWVLERLESHLPTMLKRAGADRLAGELDSKTTHQVTRQVVDFLLKIGVDREEVGDRA